MCMDRILCLVSRFLIPTAYAYYEDGYNPQSPDYGYVIWAG